MTIGIPKEIMKYEGRVAVTPDGVKKIVEQEHKVLIQSNAGEQSGYTDQDFANAGAEIKTAYEAYKMLRRSHHTKEPIGLEVRNATKEINRGLVSYGAEKEGSSSRITKVMGPTVQTLDLSLKKYSSLK